MPNMMQMSVEEIREWFDSPEGIANLEKTRIRMENEEKIKKQKIKEINKETFFIWLTEYINKHEEYNDECVGYQLRDSKEKFSDFDIRNLNNISEISNFLDSVAQIQRVRCHSDENYYTAEEYVFKFDNNYYNYRLMVGQGSVTTIHKTVLPNYCYIDLNLYFKALDKLKQAEYNEENIIKT